MRIALIVVAVGMAVLGASVARGYNDLARQREAVERAWSEVEITLQRRADLIPNLVDAVKAFAKQEKDIFENVANARAALAGARTPSEKIEASQRLDGALGRLLMVVENYPALKSNENFLRLQDELAGSENRVAVARRTYNDALQKYNTSIALFPRNLTAAVFGFKRNDTYFRAAAPAREVPRVKF
jgi:LemA protein